MARHRRQLLLVLAIALDLWFVTAGRGLAQISSPGTDLYGQPAVGAAGTTPYPLGARAGVVPGPTTSIAPPSLAPSEPYPIGNPPSPQPAAAIGGFCEKCCQSDWYARADYFHWNERAGGADFVNESGVLYTIGYQRRINSERFRFEFFGGDVTYDGGIQWDDGTFEPSTSRTRYLGLRGELEHLIEPAWWHDGAFFIGVGTRFWIRDIKGGFGDWGDWCDETQETWWTLYPYVGMEARRPLDNGLELYGSMRVGMTAVTYNYSNAYGLPVYPRLGVVAGLEIGLRGERLSLSGVCEVTTWSRSADEYYSTTDSQGNPVLSAVNQPTSTMLLVGGRLAYRF